MGGRGAVPAVAPPFGCGQYRFAETLAAAAAGGQAAQDRSVRRSRHGRPLRRIGRSRRPRPGRGRVRLRRRTGRPPPSRAGDGGGGRAPLAVRRRQFRYGGVDLDARPFRIAGGNPRCTAGTDPGAASGRAAAADAGQSRATRRVAAQRPAARPDDAPRAHTVRGRPNPGPAAPAGRLPRRRPAGRGNDGGLHCPRALAVACTRWLERHASPQTQDRFLAGLAAFERLERLPTRYITGYFVALRARKPGPAENQTTTDGTRES
jgi:hypothetical protein